MDRVVSTFSLLRSGVVSLMVGISSSAAPVMASERAFEREQLTLLIRQLDQINRQIEDLSAQPIQASARYHLDYPRLLDDLQRVRAGVQDYLTPQRAQPRDPAPMLGDYRNEQEPSP
jgi:RAQPRD family integrative conjugative element protein